MINQIIKQIKYRFFDYSERKGITPHTTHSYLVNALRWFNSSLLADGGSSAKYSLMTHEFAAGYPMSTATWVPTLSRIQQFYPEIAKLVSIEEDICRELVSWLLRTQRRDGTFPGGYGDFMNQPPVVFNNGMIIHGLLDYHNASGRSDLIEACKNSADWLLKVQSPDGSWRQFTHHQLSSNTLTAAALLRLANITGVEAYRTAGVKNLEFACDLQLENGYFKGNGISTQASAYNITVAYAIAGLIEAAILENNNRWQNAALKGIIPILNKIEQNGFLVGELDENFDSSSSFACLPGSCLIAICGYKLASLTGNEEIREKSDLLIDYVKSKQLESRYPYIAGGISGSYPVSGDYCAYEITGWGVRYFIEAVMMQDALD